MKMNKKLAKTVGKLDDNMSMGKTLNRKQRRIHAFGVKKLVKDVFPVDAGFPSAPEQVCMVL